MKRKLSTKRRINARYRPSIVTFIDILGFRSLISTRNERDVLGVVATFREYAGDPVGQSDLIVRAFSDSIVRIRPVDTPRNRNHPTGLLYHELYDLALAQVALVFQGVFVRAGVSFGKVYWDRNTVFGPAFVSSYEIESNLARMPRIAVDPALLKLLNTEPLLRAAHHDIRTEGQYIRELLEEGDDGVWHIDYLRMSSIFPEDSLYLDYLARHRLIVVELVKSAGSSLPLATKANWLVRYHNRVVAEHPGFDYLEEVRELLIDTSEIPSLADLPEAHTPIA